MIKSSAGTSVTKKEIAYYWKQKRLVEEDHLYAAIKSAARVRARNLSEYDILRFEEALENDDEAKENENNNTKMCGEENKYQEMIRVGIKDWWTKSKYAYLNEPAVKLADRPRRRSPCTYLPQFFLYKCVAPTYGFSGKLICQVK